MAKNVSEKLYWWGNGLGDGNNMCDGLLWHSAPRKYTYNKKDRSYSVTREGLASTRADGGFWAGNLGLSSSNNCITFLSANRARVLEFQRLVRKCKGLSVRKTYKIIKQSIDLQ